MTFILGIDPGLSGAVARFDPATGDLEVQDIPTWIVKGPRGNKTVIDEYGLARIIDDWSAGAVVWLEQVNAMPGRARKEGEAARTMGAQSAFNFGRGYGLIRGICVANFLTIHDCPSATWKAALKVKGDKDEARQRASALFPRHGALWPLKKHDGRAEAALIALYGAKQADPVNFQPQRAA